MTNGLAAIVLAAGFGTRLRPLTQLRPKALCPVGNRALLDRVLEQVSDLHPEQIAVNASWLAEQIVTHLSGRTHVSIEPDAPLGTSGAVGQLRDWIDGRAVLVANSDAYLADGNLHRLLAGWDGQTVRLLGVPAAAAEPEGTFAGFRFAGMSLLPWRWVRDLPATRSELVHTVWRPAEAGHCLQVIEFDGFFQDTGTLPGYLAANLHAAGGGNLLADDAVITGVCQQAVVGQQAIVHGALTRTVVWPSGQVGADEHLVDAVRVASNVTLRHVPGQGTTDPHTAGGPDAP